ncbi:MAG: hypothetical protein ACLFMT_01150, partial [Halobacteriales archaeon]
GVVGHGTGVPAVACLSGVSAPFHRRPYSVVTPVLHDVIRRAERVRDVDGPFPDGSASNRFPGVCHAGGTLSTSRPDAALKLDRPALQRLPVYLDDRQADGVSRCVDLAGGTRSLEVASALGQGVCTALDVFRVNPERFRAISLESVLESPRFDGRFRTRFLRLYDH